MARVSKASCCDFPQRQYLEDLFHENGGVFSYNKNPDLPQNYKTQCFLGKVQKESEKNGVLIILERRNK